MSLTPVYLPSANDLGVKDMLVEFEDWLLPGLHWWGQEPVEIYRMMSTTAACDGTYRTPFGTLRNSL